MRKHPHLYEINTRVFLRRFDEAGKRALIGDVPEAYWKNLSSLGIDIIWLMGVWETNDALIESCCFEEGLTGSYAKALKDWAKADIIGSPYAINRYEISSRIGTNDDIVKLRELLNSLGMKLVLDFVPNHFGAATPYLETHPDIFLQCSEEVYKSDSHTFFRKPSDSDKIFAHGRDPFFPAWTDTVQVNYYSPDARRFMTEQLIAVSKLCDGVRCDMAMLVLNNVFQNTWGGCLSKKGLERPQTEFWKDAIREVCEQKKDFLFLAEAYWNLEWELQQQGFNFTYDKRLYDRLRHSSPRSVKDHLLAELTFQEKSIRFTENHDEERAIVAFGKERSLAAAVVASTIPGMRFYNDGQFEGKRIKLPVQLGREPHEDISVKLVKQYEKLLHIVNEDIFHSGNWQLLEAEPAWEDNYSCENIFSWIWSSHNESVLVVINYSDVTAQARVKIELGESPENIVLTDLWTKTKYHRSSEEIQHIGLYVELHSYAFHILRWQH